uniref:Uncharacterized protein n=1 Tax=Anopheles atroparvus TaxID=41427 RepID=A0A182IKB9_ANOAO
MFLSAEREKGEPLYWAGLEVPLLSPYGVRGVTGKAGVSGRGEPPIGELSGSVSERYDENDSSRAWGVKEKEKRNVEKTKRNETTHVLLRHVVLEGQRGQQLIEGHLALADTVPTVARDDLRQRHAVRFLPIDTAVRRGQQFHRLRLLAVMVVTIPTTTALRMLLALVRVLMVGMMVFGMMVRID